MSVSFNTSASALQAYGGSQAVTANNIANVNTDGFDKQRAMMQEQEPAGVSMEVETVESQGAIRIDDTDAGQEQVETSNVDLNEEMPQMIENQRSFEANTKVIKTQDQMLGTLLDIKA